MGAYADRSSPEGAALAAVSHDFIGAKVIGQDSGSGIFTQKTDIRALHHNLLLVKPGCNVYHNGRNVILLCTGKRLWSGFYGRQGSERLRDSVKAGGFIRVVYV